MEHQVKDSLREERTECSLPGIGWEDHQSEQWQYSASSCCHHCRQNTHTHTTSLTEQGLQRGPLADLYLPHCLLACLLRSNLLMVEDTTSLMKRSGIPLSLANMVSSSLPVILSIRASN